MKSFILTMKSFHSIVLIMELGMGADINAIAKRCGVSKATVSRVFTNRARVSEPVRESILRMARELNYTPKRVIAREVIAIVVDSIDKTEEFDGFHSMLLVALVAEITRSDFLVNIIEARNADMLVGGYAKVAVSLLNDNQFDCWKDKMSGIKIPILSINNDPIQGGHVIATDYRDEMRMAVEHLVERGHRRIALFLDNETVLAGRERLTGYCEVMKGLGLEPLPHYSVYPEGRPMIELIATMQRTKPSAAIFCGESLPAETAYALNLLNVKVPADLSVISFERRDISRWFSPPHTTIDQDIKNMVNESIKLILKIIKEQYTEPVIRKLKSKLIIRDSVKKIK
ncbi:MAG: LacI family DNA-binding transcriptional regulator, partial [Victivallales bacterium]|nr:LacI family DNA-binding transcriptional regulator [Victivallales bacterium]